MPIYTGGCQSTAIFGGHIAILLEYPSTYRIIPVVATAAGVDLHVIFESSNVGTLKRVVETGLGWGFLPSHSIRKQVKLGRLQRIHVEDFNYWNCFFIFIAKKKKSA